MTIEKRIERIETILDARGLDWDHPRVEEEPAKEPSLDGLPDIRTFAQPNLRWRILEPGEVVQEGDWVTCRFSAPPALLGQMAAKGSVSVDGVSLTVVEAAADFFSVALIPHTLACTTLGGLAVGDAVNLETDLLFKYVARLVAARDQADGR